MLQVHNPSKISEDFVRDISRGIEYTCHCEFLSSFIADPQLTCSDRNVVLFESRLISTHARDSLLLKEDFEKWVLGETTVIVKGEGLKIVKTSHNNPTPSPMPGKQETASSQHVPVSTFGGALGGIGSVIVIIGVLITTIVLYRKKRYDR